MKRTRLTLAAALAACAFVAPSARAAEPRDFEKKIVATPSATVLTTIGQSTFADFPVLVRLPAAASALLQAADGTDLLVKDKDGTVCPFEVDTFDPSGATLVWVKVPSLSASTELTVYFSGAANQDNNPADVWSRYVAVVHGGTSIANSVAGGPAVTAGSSAVAASANAGKVGGGINKSSYNSIGVNVANPSGTLANSGKFSVSAWFKRGGNGGGDNGTHILGASQQGWGGSGFLWLQEQGKYISVAAPGSHQWSSGQYTLPDGAWAHAAFVYESGVSLTSYFNGAQDQTKASPGNLVNSAATWTFGSYQNTASGDSFKGDMDELRIFNGVASGDWIALEHATMADAAFFEYGDVEPVDPSATRFETPTAVRNANGTYTVSVVLAENSGAVGVIYNAGTTAITNIIAQSATPDTYTDTPANLTANTTYAFAAYGRNANDTEVTKKGGVFYNGDLSVETISNAVETGLVPGVFRISRADTAHDLAVAYTVGGTAVAGQTYEALSGTATIPAGTNSVDIQVVPLIDSQTTVDTTVTVTLSAGLYGIDAQADAAELTVVNLVAPEGYNTWIAQSAGLASVGSNWSAGHCPTNSENVLFDGRFSTANCEWDADASKTVASWTQAADYAGVVTFKTTFAEADATFTSFTITGDAALNKGKWTLPTATSTQTSPLYRIKVSVGGSLTIASSASIDVSGKAPWSTTSGCAYGGSCDSSSAYGNVLEPADPGQSWQTPGGATGDNAHPAFGGGAVWIEVAGSTTLDGSISANGAQGHGWDYYYGSGGGIYLKTASLSGSGTISADGNSTGGSNGGNASAGGRISILLTNASEMALPLANVHALGSSEYSHTGGAGTIVIRTTTLTNGRLVVRNLPAYGQYKYYPPKGRTTPVLANETWTFDEVVFGANGVLRVPSGTTLSLPNGLASVSGSSDLGANLGFCGILLDGGTLDISDTAATEHVVGNGAWMLSPNSPLTLNGNLTVQEGAAVGAIRLYNSATNNFTKMDLTVKGNMTVASGSYILAEGAGLTGGGAAVFAGTGYGAHGGSHGATDAEAAPVDGGYDSILSPALPGSSGSGSYRYGSGVAFLTVKGALTLNGTASANAIGGHWYGAAGTINITAGSLSGSGTITANGNRGGQWDTDNNYHLYPGGGRVAVRLTDTGATFAERWTTSIQAQGVAYMGGGSGDQRLHHTSAGTVYLQDGTRGEGAGTVRVFQNNATVNWTTVCTNDFTSFPSTRHGGENDDLRGVALEIGGGAHVLVSVDRARAGSLSIAEHSTINLNGKTLTVKRAKVGGARLMPGTYTPAKLAGYLVDSASGGELVVTGGGFSISVR